MSVRSVQMDRLGNIPLKDTSRLGSMNCVYQAYIAYNLAYKVDETFGNI
jgi:hypothetical protein